MLRPQAPQLTMNSKDKLRLKDLIDQLHSVSGNLQIEFEGPAIANAVLDLELIAEKLELELKL